MIVAGRHAARVALSAGCARAAGNSAHTPDGEVARVRMPPSIENVTAPDDSRIAVFRAVADPVLAREAGAFVAEGRQVVRRAVEAGHRVRALLVSRAVLEELSSLVEGLSGDVRVFVAGNAVFRGVTGYDIHRGCLALVERPAACDWRRLVHEAPAAAPIILLEAVANPDNIGGVFRNAAAFGAAAVLLDPACSDPLYRKAVRTSMGAVLAVPFARMTPWPEALDDLRARGWLVAALATGGQVALDAFARTRGARTRVAWLLGHEGSGLSRAALAAVDHTVRIPMAPGVDSLNLATAAALALYATTRPAPAGPVDRR